MIIAVEGLSGCGKTTVSKYLAAKLHAQYIPVPQLKFRAVSPLFATLAVEYPLVAGSFFASTLSIGLIHAEELRRKNLSSILDRYLSSTFSHLIALGVKLHDLLHLVPPIEADVTILLTCNERTRARRVSSRKEAGILAARLADKSFRKRVIDAQRLFSYDLVLQTDELSLDEITERITGLLDERNTTTTPRGN